MGWGVNVLNGGMTTSRQVQGDTIRALSAPLPLLRMANLLRSSGIFSLMTLLSRVLGFVRDQLQASVYVLYAVKLSIRK